MEIACADVGVTSHAALVFPGDEDELGVHLQLGNPKTDHHPCLLQHVADADVLLLVKARRQFHHDLHVLSVAGGVHQRVDHQAVLGDTVQVDLNGSDARVDGRFTQQIHHMHKLVVRVVQQDVALVDGVHHAGGVLQARMSQRLLSRVHQLRPAEVGEPHQVPAVVVALAGNDTCFRLQFQLAQQGLKHVLGHRPVVQETDDLARTPPLETALHLGHHRPGQIVVHVDGRVSGRLDGKRLDVNRFKQFEDPRQSLTNDVVQEHHTLQALVGRQRQEPGQVARQLDQSQLLLALCRGEANGQITLAIHQLWHFHPPSQHDGHQGRADRPAEIIVHKFRIFCREVGLVHHGDALAPQLVLKGHKRVVKFALKTGDLGFNLFQRAHDRETQRGFRFGIHGRHALQIRHANAVELVEVVGEDAQEAHAFHQRIVRRLRLLKHAVVEGQPTELSVDVTVGVAPLLHDTKMRR